MTRTLRIKNNANRSIFIKYTLSSEVKVSEIVSGETVKLTFDKTAEEKLHITCYDESSFFCIRDMPAYTWSNIRTIKLGFFFKFDCIVDVKGYYSLLEVNEFFCVSGKFIFRFFATNIDEKTFHYHHKDYEKKIINVITKIRYVFFGCFWSMFIIAGIYALFGDNYATQLNGWYISPVCFALGIIPLVMLNHSYKRYKILSNGKIGTLLHKGCYYISIINKYNYWVKYDYILECDDILSRY